MQVTILSNLSVLGVLLPLSTYAFTNCPLIGPDFPAPKSLPSSKAFQSALTNLTQMLSNALASGITSYGPFDPTNTSFSVEIFSTHQTLPLYTNYSSSPLLAESQYGTKSVDSNTIYRIGSLTKLISVYTFLIQDGDVKFNEPVTRYVPELLAAAQALNATQDPLDHVAWEDVTLGELASQMADIGRDFAGFGELSTPLFGPQDPIALGLPPLNSSELPACIGAGYCTRAQFLAGFTQRHPVYAPSTSPIYSNAAYQILAYALENITGTAFPTMVEESLFKQLGLTASSWTLPANSTAVIPPTELATLGWSIDLGDETPAGGMYSSVHDLTAIGRSILTSSLIKPVLTRRWMKPRGFVSDILNAVGAPWEIIRLQTSPNGRVVDLYTKSGDLPGYASLFILIPDFDLGWSVLAAGDNTDLDCIQISNMITDTLLPAVEAAAREEADATYSGTYASSDKTLNSSIVINTDASKPGLGVISWISNGTNLLTPAIVDPSVRLYPSGLENVLSNGDKVVGYRAVLENPADTVIGGAFTTACQSWVTVDAEYWGEVGIDEFAITVGSDGIAKSVSPRALRVDLQRVVGTKEKRE